MNLLQFQFWLDGYMDGKGEIPSLSEWQRIRAKMHEETSRVEVDFSKMSPATLSHPVGYNHRRE